MYKEIGDWAQLEPLLPKLARQGEVPADRLEQTTRETYAALLCESALETAELTTIWQRMPKTLRQDATLIRAYVDSLAMAGDCASAEKVARKALKREVDPDLVLSYAALDGGDPQRQLQQVETWLADHGETAELLLAAARLSMRQSLWGKARGLLEASIALRPRADAYAELGKLLEHLDEFDAAREAYRAGLDAKLVEPSDEAPERTLLNPESIRLEPPAD